MRRSNPKGVVYISYALALMMLCGCENQQESPGITIGQRHSVKSAIMGEEREYLVYLPGSYEEKSSSQKTYPVLYLLDGGAHFQSASGVIQFMSAGINGNLQIPELIVVAIPNTNRTRDLTPTHTTIGYDGEESDFLKDSGGGDAFLGFIREELFPLIESSYRTAPHRTLVGHSFGGLLALHTLLEKPEMFQAYIAIDPSLWWDDQVLVSRAEQIYSSDADRKASVYISLANNPDIGSGEPKLMEKAGRAFVAITDNAISRDMNLALQYFDAEDHGSVPLLSLYYGLLRIFEGYKLPFELAIEQPSAITSHFEAISNRLGIQLLPPETMMNNLGYFLLHQFEEPGKALEILKINVMNYPESSNAFDSLAEAYEMNGDKELAIENYEKALELNPGNEGAVEKLEELRGQE